jgi:hypothetical protein
LAEDPGEGARHIVSADKRKGVLVLIAVSHTRIGGCFNITPPLRRKKAITSLRQPRQFLIKQPGQFRHEFM